ncbi:recombinase family protein [Nakamurella sp. PAMC28650]|uniref:recombinase family protein n=1 Tax=Nakamurella sp. PAMC28650 TaxID=2762325 RepID=UPI00164D9A54|nr:recombinase family protein [Nakamurella sp. PAMC28650]QNK80901.1 recombinase family protein [Nakamurella sp. PAMC28650]
MARPRKTSNSRPRPLALGYVRVSTTDQVDNGASLDAQRAALTAEAARRGWDLEIVADEGLSAKTMNRPALQDALDRLDRGDADALLSIRLDRISRSVADFAGLIDRAGRKGWGLVLLSPNIDLADPAGRFTANVLASAAQYERELIGVRTREGMAQRKAEGVKFGRTRNVPDAVLARILAAHADGSGWSTIARALNSEGVPTAQGGRVWYPATVRKVCLSGTNARSHG